MYICVGVGGCVNYFKFWFLSYFQCEMKLINEK